MPIKTGIFMKQERNHKLEANTKSMKKSNETNKLTKKTITNLPVNLLWFDFPCCILTVKEILSSRSNKETVLL